MVAAPIIDSDICKAHTLPSRYYTEESLFSDILSRLSNSFHFAAHVSQLNENSIIPLPQLENILGEALILTKDEQIRCLSNVCTHRGMLIATKPCDLKSLKCGYHGRTFGLDGCMRNMPEFTDVENFPTDSDNLREFNIKKWNGIIFLGGEQFYDAVINEMQNRIGWMNIESFEYDESRHRSYDINANWALYVDNYLEGFHIPFVHGDLHSVLDYDSYSTELFEGGVLQIGIANEGEACFDLPESSPDFGKKIAAYYYWIYPGLMLNFYPWGLSVNVVSPISVDRTRIVYHGFVGEKSMLGKGAGGDLDRVEAEDQEIVEATQRGVSSKSYERGRYSPSKEKGVHHFHRILTNSSDNDF
ncbi:Rieske 2Fe-2S domain-containing protein [Euryarchaeota archaeon]|nr:Rieske 2Fe-2S domain-containing protein [Euryarchaeota archaeon]